MVRLSEEAEVRLIRRAQAGDKHAYSQLYELYRKMIAEFARKHTVPGAELDDLQSIMLIAFYESIRDFQFDRNSNRLSTILMWKLLTAYDHEIRRVAGYKRSRSQKLKVVDSVPYSQMNVDEFKDTFFGTVYDQYPSLHQTDLPISDKNMEVVQMMADGYTLKEVAEKFGVTKQAISHTILRVRRKLVKRNMDFGPSSSNH